MSRSRFPALALPLLACIAVLTMVCASLPAAAAERVWKLERFSGEVIVMDGAGKAYAIGPGFVVRPGDRVITGATGRAMISRGGDSIVMSLNAMIEIPIVERQGETPTVVQRQGSSRFQIEKQPLPHFLVETPHLGALVKGTTFTVEVQDRASRIVVAEGVVQVGDFGSGDSADIRATQSAESGSEPGKGLALAGEGPGPLPIIRRGPPRTPLLATPRVAEASMPTAQPLRQADPSLAGLPATPPPMQAAQPPQNRLAEGMDLLNRKQTPEALLALVVLGAVGAGGIVWILLAVVGALRRSHEGMDGPKRRRD